MDDFASFTSGGDTPKKTDKEWKDEAESVLRSCQGKSEADILRAIFAGAVEGKRNGTLSNEQIDMFYNQFAPMLDGAKRKRLKKLVEELKAL